MGWAKNIFQLLILNLQPDLPRHAGRPGTCCEGASLDLWNPRNHSLSHNPSRERNLRPGRLFRILNQFPEILFCFFSLTKFACTHASAV
jgi:hypothetical protein